MRISKRESTPSTKICIVEVELGEKYTHLDLYLACDSYYTPHLGGMINPFGKSAFKVTVYTD